MLKRPSQRFLAATEAARRHGEPLPPPEVDKRKAKAERVKTEKTRRKAKEEK